MDEIVELRDNIVDEKARRLPPTRCNDGGVLPLPTNADDIVCPAAADADVEMMSTSSK